MTRILLGISASISAYKAADLANELTKKGYQVETVMTQHATQFITPLTIQSLTKERVHTDVLAEDFPAEINHIDLAKRTDLFLIAPASANIIGKLANGLADDMLSTVALALAGVPKLIAPAMNTRMYEHPAVQRNLRTLQEDGYQIIEPRTTLLACGDVGKGALAATDTIIHAAEALL